MAEAETAMELSVLEMELSNQESEHALVIRQDEFEELDRGNERAEEQIIDKKVFHHICMSLEYYWCCQA